MAPRARPSLTARIVAVTRGAVDRPTVPTGDPAAEDRLTQTLRLPVPMAGRMPGMAPYIAARTRFFDEHLLRACESGTRQVVIVGAGYDARSLRFRQPGVDFFEVDHPKTQADKVARLAELAVDVEGVRFVAVDLGRDSLVVALAAAGHDRAAATHFVCEGLTPYLPMPVLDDLLRKLADIAGPRSTITVDFAGPTPDRSVVSRTRLTLVRLGVAALGERMVTLLTQAEAASLLTRAGWSSVEFRPPPPALPVLFASARPD